MQHICNLIISQSHNKTNNFNIIIFLLANAASYIVKIIIRNYIFLEVYIKKNCEVMSEHVLA